jgi:dihydroorotate dehydrogenase
MRLFSRALRMPVTSTIFKETYQYEDPSLHRTVAGLTFKNPIGLAAGFDKDGKYFKIMSALGFSHIEIGTITPKPQAGNPKPRLFRLIRSRGLINRMGFNNEGVEALAERLKVEKLKSRKVERLKSRKVEKSNGSGVKNKDTPNEEAVNDYLICFRALYDLVDYFTVNVSSPNTPGLRSLQEKEPLIKLLTALQNENHSFKPIFLKIAPDLDQQQLDEIIDIVIESKIAGVIATNTTITRDHLKESKEEIDSMGAGGLSGAPLLEMSVGVVKYLSEKSQKRFAIIGVGGIEDYDSAKKHLDAGADLIQIYTGLIYSGPKLINTVLKRLVKSNDRL